MKKNFGRPIHVRIKSHNRPKHLSNLLMDLYRQSGDLAIALDLVVFDDASTVSMLAPRSIVQEAGWRWCGADNNYGKPGAWALHNRMYESLRDVDAAAIIYFFDDDMRLCERFFGASLSVWRGIQDPNKATLHLMVDSSRDNSPCWTGVLPRKINGDVRRTQWVDGSFMCQRSMLDTLDFKLNEVAADRWKKHPNRSTGVGEQLSHRLHACGRGLYQSYRSLLVHAAAHSQYNPGERKKHPLQTIRFIDGTEVAKRLMRSEEIQCSMATIPSRIETLRRVTQLIYGQVDLLRVYLNGFTEVPEFLQRPRILAVCSGEADGDLGDRGKFYWARDASGYQLTIDDDLHYPANYVDRIIAALERYNRRAVVGVHAIRFKDAPAEQINSYYKARNVTHFSLKLDRDEAVHLVGTGTFGYHPEGIHLEPRDFPHPNMADIWVGRQTQRQRVPVVAIARPANWLRPYPTEGSIFDTASHDDAIQTEATKAIWPWVLHKASQSPGHHHELCSGGGAPGACRCRLWRKSGYDPGKSVRHFVRSMRDTRATPEPPPDAADGVFPNGNQKS